jgi:hypothetical protein
MFSAGTEMASEKIPPTALQPAPPLTCQVADFIQVSCCDAMYSGGSKRLVYTLTSRGYAADNRLGDEEGHIKQLMTTA